MLSRRNHTKAVQNDQGDGANVLLRRHQRDDEVADNELIDRTLDGDTEAFGCLVSRYQDRLYNTLVHVGGSFDEARDIVQEAFVQAFVKLDTFQRAAGFYTWLYRIAFNLRIGLARRERRRAALQQAQRLTGGESEQRELGPSAPLESAECARQVRAALDLLAEDYREVLVLRDMDGCCYEEIARILHVPLGTVRSRLHRARAQLREHLQPVYREQLRT
jgi:RNA polymerase sigma-70 factor (ECF subfamily)